MSRIFYQPPQPFLGGRQPLEPRKLTPELLAVPEDNPPFASGLRSFPVMLALVAFLWQPAPVLPQSAPKLVPQQEAAADNPPFGLKSSIPNIVEQWHPGFVLPQTSPRLISETRDDPTFGIRPTLPGIVEQWYRVDPTPTQGKHLPINVTAVAEDNPPFNSRSVLPGILEQWQPGPPLPYQRTRILYQAGPNARGRFCRIKGSIAVSMTGTLTVRFAQSVSSGVSSVMIGSDFIIIEDS